VLDTDNGRVTLAILGEKIDTLVRAVDSLRPDHDRLIVAEQCIKRNADGISEIEKMLADVVKDTGALKSEVAKIALVAAGVTALAVSILTAVITTGLGL